jgi:hypothetical protein
MCAVVVVCDVLGYWTCGWCGWCGCGVIVVFMLKLLDGRVREAILCLSAK